MQGSRPAPARSYQASRSSVSRFRGIAASWAPPTLPEREVSEGGTSPTREAGDPNGRPSMRPRPDAQQPSSGATVRPPGIQREGCTEAGRSPRPRAVCFRLSVYPSRKPKDVCTCLPHPGLNHSLRDKGREGSLFAVGLGQPWLSSILGAFTPWEERGAWRREGPARLDPQLIKKEVADRRGGKAMSGHEARPRRGRGPFVTVVPWLPVPWLPE